MVFIQESKTEGWLCSEVFLIQEISKDADSNN